MFECVNGDIDTEALPAGRSGLPSEFPFYFFFHQIEKKTNISLFRQRKGMVVF